MLIYSCYYCIVPPCFTKPLENTTTLVNSVAELSCCTKSHPLPSFKWFKDGQLLSGSELQKIQIENASTSLTLTNVQFTDEGCYEVHALNEAGEVKCEGNLKVYGNSNCWF